MAKKWLYLVSYNYSSSEAYGFGCAEYVLDKKLNSFEEAMNLMSDIKERNGFDKVVIIAINFWGRG